MGSEMCIRDRSRTRKHFHYHDLSSECFLDIGEMNSECSKCGALHYIDERLLKSTASDAEFSICCSDRQKELPLLEEPPLLIKTLLTSSTRISKHFRDNIRAYNSVLSMASCTPDFVNRGPGNSAFNPTMTVHGRVYHYICSLIPPRTIKPTFASFYVFDTDEEQRANIRSNGMGRSLNQELLMDLVALLMQVNSYVQSFKSLRQ